MAPRMIKTIPATQRQGWRTGIALMGAGREDAPTWGASSVLGKLPSLIER